MPAGVGPGMGFMVAGPDGSQFQVQCPPDAKEGMMITVAVPTPAVAVAQPMMMAQQPVGFGQQMAQMNVPPGNTFLLGIHGLYVRQALEVVEMLTDCETKNRYSFTPIPLGTPVPACPDSSWSKEYRSAAGFNPLLKGKEESECFERVCCPLFRGFKMDLVDGNGTPFITFDRPFKCDPCYSPGCFTCTTQEMSVSAGGAMIANAKMVTGPCCTSGCCNNKFEVYNASGAIITRWRSTTAARRRAARTASRRRAATRRSPSMSPTRWATSSRRRPSSSPAATAAASTTLRTWSSSSRTTRRRTTARRSYSA